jgi:murein DD-endopeptidase MepM/ murein hydrolase activator NlpD
MEGTVIRVTDSNTGFGKHVVVDHGDGLSSLYAHLSSLDVVPGQQVQPGSIIGLEGSTGASTGPHVHFTIMVASIPVNPRIFMVGQPLSCR